MCEITQMLKLFCKLPVVHKFAYFTMIFLFFIFVFLKFRYREYLHENAADNSKSL